MNFLGHDHLNYKQLTSGAQQGCIWNVPDRENRAYKYIIIFKLKKNEVITLCSMDVTARGVCNPAGISIS